MLAKRVASEFLKGLDHPRAGLKLIYHFVSPELPAHETPANGAKLPPPRLAKIACDILYCILQQDENLSSGYRTELQNQENTGIFFTNLSSIWKVIRTAIEDCGANPIYFLIDGIDGLEGSLCKKLIERILYLMNTRTVKIFLSSRHVPHVSNFLCKHTKINLDTNRFVKDDLETFVSHRLNQLHGWNDTLKKRVRETILEKAEGTFLWASLVIEDLSYNCSGPDFDDFFRQPPPGLNDVYRKMLDPLSGKRKQRVVLNMIQSVAIALRPLTFGELAHILACIEQKSKSEKQPSHYRESAEIRPRKEDEIRKYVQSSLGFLRATEATVSIVHHTAIEYLFDEKRQDGLVVLSKSEADLTVSWECFRYLHYAFSHPEKFPKGNVSDYQGKPHGSSSNQAYREEPGGTSWEVARKDPQRAVEKWPCLRYAAESWFIHARRTVRTSKDELYDESARNWLQHQFFETSDIVRKPWIKLCGDSKMEALAGDQTPLCIAVCLGLMPLVEKALSESTKGKNRKQSPLHLAAQFMSGTYTILITKGEPSFLTGPDESGNTPLHAAAENGHWPMVVGLVKRFKAWGQRQCSREINKQNDSGNTSLHLALRFDHPDIAQFLYLNGADLSVKNDSQMTALELGAKLGRAEISRILKEAGKIRQETEKKSAGRSVGGAARETATEAVKKPGKKTADEPAGESEKEPAKEPEGETAGESGEKTMEQPGRVSAGERVRVPARERVRVPARVPASVPAGERVRVPARMPASVPVEEPVKSRWRRFWSKLC